MFIRIQPIIKNIQINIKNIGQSKYNNEMIIGLDWLTLVMVWQKLQLWASMHSFKNKCSSYIVYILKLLFILIRYCYIYLVYI